MGLLIGDIFRRHAASTPARVAASLGTGTLTYAQLDRRANGFAHALREQGVERGDRVLWWGDTALGVVPVFAALAKLGAVFAPINARYGVDECTQVAGLARARLLVADRDHAEAGAAVAAKLGLPPVAVLGETAPPAFDLQAAAARADTSEPTGPGPDERDPHVIFFTSGSTGRPKGVVLSHRANALRSLAGTFSEPECVVCMFPLFHMAGWTLALGAWQGRGEIVFVESASAASLLDAVERRRATRLYCIPAVWARILAVDTASRDLSSLREVDTGTSATPPELIHALKARFPGTRTRIAYGSTEAGSAARLDEVDVLRKPGAVGPAAPGVELRLTPAGEVCVRSEVLMDGYFEDPEATSAALVNGWYHTGDLGSFDAEGYLSIVGRVRDVIRTGGESVSPAEVEAALADHPDVEEIAVVGLPDAEWGELVCAVVVPRSGAGLTLAALSAHAADRLAAFKQPRRLVCTDALPRTPATGQIQRALLVERLAAGN